MRYLDVPGARLYYETHGTGPIMVMIAGAGGTADVFRMVAARLSARYTVVSYDRRGFSRSRFVGPHDDGHRLVTDADDVRRLIRHLGDQPAIVFGASSGAIVGLTALARHPDAIGTLVPFEPPVMRYLPNGQKWNDVFTELYAMYRRVGIDPALEAFRERTFPPTDRHVMAHAPRNDANAAYWFEHELRQYPAVELDLDALARYADRIVPAVGREGHGYPCHDVTVILSQTLGRRVVELPGGHAGCVSHAEEFADGLIAALERTGAPMAQTSPNDRDHRGNSDRHAVHDGGHGRGNRAGHDRGQQQRHSPALMSAGEWNDWYVTTPHWDLGRPQPAMRALADAAAIRGRVLDVGCGTGEHVLMCAALGLDATGIDIAPAALHIAEDKAQQRGLSAQFVLGDARRLTALGRCYDTVLDCGLFHVLDDDDRAVYVRDVRNVLVPGGRFLMLCVSNLEPGDRQPGRVARDDIIAAFADGWRIDSLQPTTLESPTGSAAIRA